MHAMLSSSVPTAPPRKCGGGRAKRRRTTPAPLPAAPEGRAMSPPPAAPSPSLLPPELERAWTARAPTAWHSLGGPDAWQVCGFMAGSPKP